MSSGHIQWMQEIKWQHVIPSSKQDKNVFGENWACSQVYLNELDTLCVVIRKSLDKGLTGLCSMTRIEVIQCKWAALVTTPTIQLTWVLWPMCGGGGLQVRTHWSLVQNQITPWGSCKNMPKQCCTRKLNISWYKDGSVGAGLESKGLKQKLDADQPEGCTTKTR